MNIIPYGYGDVFIVIFSVVANIWILFASYAYLLVVTSFALCKTDGSDFLITLGYFIGSWNPVISIFYYIWSTNVLLNCVMAGYEVMWFVSLHVLSICCDIGEAFASRGLRFNIYILLLICTHCRHEKCCKYFHLTNVCHECLSLNKSCDYFYYNMH